MDGSALLERLAALVGDLEPFEGAERAELDQAISAITTNLSAPRPEFLAFRRELPISTTAFPGGLPAAAAGRSVRPVPPATQLYVFLYAQVLKCDSSDYYNVLLSQKRAVFPQNPPFPPSLPDALYGTAVWTNDEIAQLLASLTLGPDTPLRCLAAETMPVGSTLPTPSGVGR